MRRQGCSQCGYPLEKHMTLPLAKNEPWCVSAVACCCQQVEGNTVLGAINFRRKAAEPDDKTVRGDIHEQESGRIICEPLLAASSLQWGQNQGTTYPNAQCDVLIKQALACHYFTGTHRRSMKKEGCVVYKSTGRFSQRIETLANGFERKLSDLAPEVVGYDLER